MSATKLPDQAPPTNAPTVTKEYIPGVGEVETREWRGERSDMETKYAAYKYEGEGGAVSSGNMTGLRFATDAGRSRCMLRIERNNVANSYGSNVKIVEELYAINIVRDVRCAPYFCAGGDAALTDDQVADVMDAVDHNYLEAEITNWATWIDAQKQLRYHMLHGQDSYYETGFVLRASLYGVITSKIKASFTFINEVVPAPVFLSPMDDLLASLPTGEWLHRPPQSEHLGKGKWRITREWHWAAKWSKMYGGTWGL